MPETTPAATASHGGAGLPAAEGLGATGALKLWMSSPKPGTDAAKAAKALPAPGAGPPLGASGVDWAVCWMAKGTRSPLAWTVWPTARLPPAMSWPVAVSTAEKPSVRRTTKSPSGVVKLTGWLW